MEETSFQKKRLHIGQRIERVRMFRGIKQDYLASKLGVSQQTVSNIEKQETIEADLLKQIADILGVSPELIESFDEDKITYIINNVYDFHDFEVNDSGSFVAQQVNPIEKLAELYERLLQSEREKLEILRNIKN